jgi:hypothetical protein
MSQVWEFTIAGLFAERRKLDQITDCKDQSVLGCDRVQNAIYEKQLFGQLGELCLSPSFLRSIRITVP